MKGILLAGGSGTRLYPATITQCKQLLPVYDKPLIYYPLSTLLLMGIKEILIISTPHDTPHIEKLLGDGSSLGISLSYAVQNEPKGIAEALLIGEEFIAGDDVTLILGDNIFYGHNLVKYLSVSHDEGATVFGYYVQDPERYGVVSFDKNRAVESLEEKPQNPQSNYAVTGLYIYDSQAVDRVKKLRPSKRGELEITGLNQSYLAQKKLRVEIMGRGFAWLDTGTHESMMEASLFVKTIEDRTGLKIGCIEEVAWRKGYISDEQFKVLANNYPNSSYGAYLRNLLERDVFV